MTIFLDLEDVPRDKYFVLLLNSGLVTVPKKLLTEDKTYTYWPPKSVKSAEITKLIRNDIRADKEDWDLCRIYL